MDKTLNVVKKLLLPIGILLLAQSSFALSVCLNARSNGNITNGHAFITIEDEKGKIVESYGYWPLSETRKQSLTINIPADNPLNIIKARWGLTKKQEAMSEARLCQNTNATIAQTRKLALSYPGQFGKYSLMSNNCTHFAIRIYNQLSGDTFPVVQSPTGARREIKKVLVGGVRSYKALR